MKDVLKVLVTAPARQDPKIFREYRESIDRMIVPDGYQVDTYFVINDCPELIPCLYPSDHYDVLDTGAPYSKTHNDHIWSEQNIINMETLRNKTIEYALDNDYDYWFSVDTDLVLHPLTLSALIKADKDIISELFWSVSQDKYRWCNAWLYDQASGMLHEWETPGVYPVGMTGACTLVKRKVLEAGVNYTRIHNIHNSLRGEDRHFSVRAAVLGFELWIDTYYPPVHLYTESEYQKYMAKKQDRT